MRKKLCVYPTCNSDSRYYNKEYMNNVFFIPFPKAKKSFDKCKEWITWLNRSDYPLSRINDNTYLCSKHFVGKIGPTTQFPDPIHDHSKYVSILKCNTTRTELRSNNIEPLIEKENFPPTDNSQFNVSLEGHTSAPLIERSVPNITNVHDATVNVSNFSNMDATASNLYDLLEGFTLPIEWAASQIQGGFKLYRFKKGTNSIVYCIKLDETFSAKYEVLGKELENIDSYNLPLQINSKDTLKNVLILLDGYKPCGGNIEKDMIYIFENRLQKNGLHNPVTGGIHSMTCKLLVKDSLRNRCFFCAKQRLSLQVTISRKKKRTDTSITKFSNLNKGELTQKLRKSKTSEVLVKRKLKRLQQKMAKQITKKGKAIEVSDKDHEYLLKILQDGVSLGHDEKTTDFSRLFFRTQLKMLTQKNKNRRRWHPLVIQWCLFMYAKSPSLYKSLNESGVLILPSKSTLVRNADTTGATPGFHSDVFHKMKKDFQASAKGEEEYFFIVADEIKTEEDLVYRVETGDVIGYTHLSQADQKLSEIQSECYKEKPLATHILQFMARGVTNGFQRPFAHFATHSVTAETLDSLLWEAIQKLELSGFKILGVVGDGAATNRKCFNMNCKEQPFKCPNPFDRTRNVFFICDVPHLIKTVRNCLERSKEIGGSRIMQINGEKLTWNILQDLFKKDMDRPGNLRKLHKLTSDHLYLENRMKVKLATQILSKSVKNALKAEYGEDHKELVRFIGIFNKWFDIMNVGHLYEGSNSRNENLKPFTTKNDPRLHWLKETFLGYLNEWETYVNNIEAKPSEKKKMLLSRETLSGLRQTTYAMLEIIPFLLEKGAKFVLTAKFNQDPVEQLFSKHRQACKAGSKPTVYQYSRNGLRLQTLKEGNVIVKAAGANTETC